MRRIRPRLTYANVVSSIALFAVLGGGAYATHTHRMGTQDLKNRAVTAPKVANNAVVPRTIRQNAVRPAKISTGAVRRRHIFNGAVNAAKIDSSEVQQRVSQGCGLASAVASIASNGTVNCNGFVRAEGSVRARRDFVNFDLSGAQTFNFGQIELRKLATPGQAQVCRTAVTQANPWVMYVNGSRFQGTSRCTTIISVGNVHSDFEVKMRRTRIWSTHSGDNGTARTFSVISVGEL